MTMRPRLPQVVATIILTGTLAACLEPVHEFSENDFTNASRFFCQKPNYTSSPLQANSYVLYYDSESQLGNVGQFVYMGDYEWFKAVEEANPYATYRAIVTDDNVMLYLDHMKDDKTLHILIDRKSLDVKFNYKSMECKKVDTEQLITILKELAEEHRAYHIKDNKLNQL